MRTLDCGPGLYDHLNKNCSSETRYRSHFHIDHLSNWKVDTDSPPSNDKDEVDSDEDDKDEDDKDEDDKDEDDKEEDDDGERRKRKG